MNDTLEVENVNYFISNERLTNILIHFAFKDNIIYKYSSDFFHIRKHIKNLSNVILNTANHFIQNHKTTNKCEYIKEEVVCFISSFTCGSVHGYASIWEYMIHYLKINSSSMVLLSTVTQNGIVQLVSKVIGYDKIIFLAPNVLYEIKKITFVPLQNFMFYDDVWKITEPYFKQYILSEKHDKYHERICIVKSSACSNTTSTGVIDVNEVQNWCDINGYYNLIPSKHDEIKTANILWNCERFITSWGTAYYKNIRYIGDLCQNIYVLIPPEFERQYQTRKNKPHSHTYTKYKNANVRYIHYDKLKDLTI